MAVRRWSLMSRNSTVLLRLERGGGATKVCVRGGGGASDEDEDEDEGREGVCSRWLRSKRLSSVILSSVADLQGALSHTGSSPPSVISAARSALSRLLDHILDQSDPSPSPSSLIGWLRLGLPPPKPNVKALVSELQRHFLLFSQRLHSVEVERRGLRLEVANLKRGLRQGKVQVPEERFQTVCLELRRALTREEEAQTLIQEQFNQLQTLQLRVDAHNNNNNNNNNNNEDTQHTLGHAPQALSEARLEASRKDRSLRILGKHLAGVQREKRGLEEKLRRAEDELRDAARRQDAVVGFMKAAETSYEQVSAQNGLVQSQRSPSAKPHPLLLPAQEHLSGAESIVGAPEVAACQSFLSVVSRLVHALTSGSAHRSDSHAFTHVAELPESLPLDEPQPVPLSDSSKGHDVCISPAHARISSSPLTQPNPVLAKSKDDGKPTKKKKTKTKRVNVKR